MLGVWVTCSLAFALLPYQLLERPFSLVGLASLAVFVLAFVVGTLMVRVPRSVALQPIALPSGEARAQRVLAVACVLASICLLLDAQGKDVFDLVLAYEQRSEAADALLKGEASSSSIWFQLSFLLYPAGYVFTGLHILYAPRIRVLTLALIGLTPIVLATIAMGGRVPIFYALLVAGLAWRERRKLAHAPRKPLPFARRLLWIMLIAVFALGMFTYFATVFVIRAQVVGGTEGMFEVAANLWGIGFRGPGSDMLFALLGADTTYMLFVFVWYLVQGLVMANYLFSAYDGPMQMGVYGVDLMSALLRRVAPERVAQGFDFLMSLGTYGFLPSAWGSLWVDFAWAGLLPCVIWGAFTAWAWRRIVRERQGHWLLVGPFVSLGILFSLINTPIGFTNGLITHLWLAAAFLMLKPARQAAPIPR
jgi:hypothetical protein